MTAEMQPTVYIIAGPNGAGKTTFAMRYLPAVVHCAEFINADLIARGLSPLNERGAQVRATLGSVQSMLGKL